MFIPLIVILYHIGIYFDQNYDYCHYCLESQKPEVNKGWIKPLDFKMSVVDSIIETKADGFTNQMIYQVYYEDDTFNINLLSNSTARQKKSMLIIAGVHGNEPAGVYAIPSIIEVIKEKGYPAWDFDIIYAINPVGLEKFARHNENGCNIVRDFKKFITIQGRTIRDLVDTSNYQIVLDLHEGPYSGSVIFKNRLVKYSLKKKITQDLMNQDIVISEYNNYRFKIARRLKLYSMNSILAKTTDCRTLAHYLAERGIMIIISESNVLEEDFNQRIKSHVILFESLMDNLNKEK
jgi:hypothetical protein